MSKVYTTEITSGRIPSDNPIHQRLLKAYVLAQEYIQGDVLEVGCGEGRGIDWIIRGAKSFTAIDKIGPVIDALKTRYPQGRFFSGNIPPLTVFGDHAFDRVVSFQVIEHIENDLLFLEEIFRVLRPGGIAMLTTPNRLKSLTRNPWHVREYTGQELTVLAKTVFPSVEMRGITGNEKVMRYYEQNRNSVRRIARFDILDLEHRLPASWLRVPYELMNRWNRNNLQDTADGLVASINHFDYILTDQVDQALDLLLIVKK